MILHLEFSSKSKNFIIFFLSIINTYFLKNQLLSCGFFHYQFAKKTKKKTVTVLKSPHVNKKAKKKFIFQEFKVNVILILNENKKELFFYKLMIIKFFVNFKLKVIFQTNNKENIKNFILNKNFEKNQINKYMFLLDSYGENLFAKKSLNSF